MGVGVNGVNGTYALYLAEGLVKVERVNVIIRHLNTVVIIARWMVQLAQNLNDVTKTHAQVSVKFHYDHENRQIYK